MGRMMMCSCQKCGYQYRYKIGNGFNYPDVYQDTVSSAETGLHGEDIKKFLEENPDGVIDAQNVLLQCKQCGSLDNRLSLSMYIPKKGYKRINGTDQIWSTAAPYTGYEYISPLDIFIDYTLYKTYNHKCESCGGNMEIVDDGYAEMQHFKEFWETKVIVPMEHARIKCPSCGSAIEPVECGRWD